MNDNGHMNGMAAGDGASSNGTMNRRHMMMHMTLFWGENAEILFHGWPGYHRPGMYSSALAFVFFLALFVEWLSHCNILRRVDFSASETVLGLLQTLLYALRIGFAYIVMLAVMSFNAGVFLVAIAGHCLGFFLFGSRAFNKPTAGIAAESEKPPPNLPPLNCC